MHKFKQSEKGEGAIAVILGLCFIGAMIWVMIRAADHQYKQLKPREYRVYNIVSEEFVGEVFDVSFYSDIIYCKKVETGEQLELTDNVEEINLSSTPKFFIYYVKEDEDTIEGIANNKTEFYYKYSKEQEGS